MSRVAVPSVLIAAAVILAGCGKSAEMKKMEADLFSSLKQMHDEGMDLMVKAGDLSDEVDQAIASFDSLAAAHPKETAGHTMDDLKVAKLKLAGAMTAMNDWMAALRPYEDGMKHEDAMALLGGEKDGIVKVKGQFDEAIASASASLRSQKAFADELAGKFAKGRSPAGVVRRNKNAGVE